MKHYFASMIGPLHNGDCLQHDHDTGAHVLSNKNFRGQV